MASGKAPGSDGIPPDQTKHCKTILLFPLHSPLELYRRTWKTPISLLSTRTKAREVTATTTEISPQHRRKVFVRVLLIRLQQLAERVYPESQFGFRAERSTVDMVLSLRQLQQNCIEQQMPLYIAFIDHTKASDLVSRVGLFMVLPNDGCPPTLQTMVEFFQSNMKRTVQFNSSSVYPFEIRCGVKQGCILALTIFGIFFALFVKRGFDITTEGIYLRTRSDGKLFNLARIRAKIKVRQVLVRAMLFAEDAAVATRTQ